MRKVTGDRFPVTAARGETRHPSPVTRHPVLKAGLLLTGALLLVTSSACRQEMYDQPRYKALGRSRFFADQRQSRPPVDGTVARGMLRADSKLYAGKDGNTLVAEFPLPVTRALLDRGRQRFNIYCAPCHDRTGGGNGMVVQRGYRPPPSFHLERVRSQPVGHFFDVITNGFGAMPDYAAQIDVQDRWAIIAYVRALQLSQAATVADVPPDAMGALDRPEASVPIPPYSPALPTLYHSAPIPGSSPQSPSGGPAANPSRKGAH